LVAISHKRFLVNWMTAEADVTDMGLYVCMFHLDPVLLDTQLSIVCAQWSYNGSVLAIGGQHIDNKESSYICFYTPLGSVRLM